MTKKHVREIKQITSTVDEFQGQLFKAKEIIASWPDWKQKTPATSYPRPLSDNTESKLCK